jgi:hypothetical protein
MKPIRLLMLAVVILLGAGYAFRNPLLKGRLEKALSEQTGFGVELGRLHVGWNLSSFEVAGARLLNPPDFPLRRRPGPAYGAGGGGATLPLHT